MQHTNSLPKNLWCMTLFSILLLNVIPTYATIPSTITGLYQVASTDNCPTTCTIQNGGVLTIAGSGTAATFSGSITIMPGGKLNITNGATVKMAAGTKIAVKSTTSSSVESARINVDNGHITSTATGVFWSGIETSRGSLNGPYQAYVDIENGSIIENATVAYRDYDSGNPNINATSGWADVCCVLHFPKQYTPFSYI